MISRLCLISLALSCAAFAETVPVIAKITMTNQVVMGKSQRAVPVSITEGMLYRASDGSTLRQFKDRGELATPHKFYELDYYGQRILELPHPQGVENYRGMKSLGEDTVAGIRCKLIAVEAQGPTDVSPKQVGTACVSEEYGLMLRQDTSYPRKDGTVAHSIMELSNVQLHTEPDASVFALPAGFSHPVNTDLH